MARKIEYRIRDWLPSIIIASIEYEELTTKNVFFQVGGRLQHIPDSGTQYEEVKSVLDLLVKMKFIVEESSNQDHYWGIDFENVHYKINHSFAEFIKNAQTFPSQASSSNDEFVQINVNQKNYIFNLTFAIDKLAEFKLF